jgi:hypothetical protein
VAYLDWGVLLGSTALLTVLSVVIELLAGSSVDFESGWKARSCWTKPAALYLALTLVANSLLAAIALPLLRNRAGSAVETFLYFDYVLAAFAAVFFTKVVLSNTNITVFNNGLLEFQNWIIKARDPAILAATAKQGTMQKELKYRMARDIKGSLPEKEIQSVLIDTLDQDEVSRLEDKARDTGADPTLYKLMQLAQHHQGEATALYKHAKNQRRER